MRKPAAGRGALALLILCLAASPALAQGKKGKGKGKGSAGRLEEIQRKVDLALKASGDAATANKAVQEVQNELSALKKEMAKLRAGGQAIIELRQRLEGMTRHLLAMEKKLAQAKAELQASQLNAGFKDGFFLRDSSNHFMLRLRGFFQGGFAGRLYSEELTYTGGTLGETESSFELRRAGFELYGHVIRKIMKYRLAFDFGSLDPGPVLEAYGDLRIFGPLQLRFGRQKIPISRQFLVHSAYQHFTERSEVVNTFAPGWDLGLVIHGEINWIGPVTYQFGIFNGAGGLAPVDDNTDFLYSARLVYEPLGKIPYSEGDALRGYYLSVGGSFAYNLAPTDIHLRNGETDAKKAAVLRDGDADGNIDNVGVFLLGAELTARLAYFLWHSEFYYRMEDPGVVGETRKFWGVFTQLGTVPQHGNYEFAVRYGYRLPSYYGLTRTMPRAESIHEAAGVASLFTWKRRLKWQIEYRFQFMQDLRTRQGTTETTVLDSMIEHQVRLQAQLYF